MKRRDKLILAGTSVLLLSVGAAAMLVGGNDSKPAAIAQPTPEPFVDQKNYGPETLRTIAKMPSLDEVPQEFKEAENYLLDRWGHMEDAGLTAPGIMPEGDMYFQDRKILSGVRGNGKPIYAKAFLRPERFRGPEIKSHGDMKAALDRNPSLSMPGRSEAQATANVVALAKRAGVVSDKTKDASAKMRPLEETPGSEFRPRGAGTTSGTAGDGLQDNDNE